MFVFKDKSTKEMNVVVNEISNLIAKSSMRVSGTQIEGRNGETYDELGYSNVEIELQMKVMDVSRMDEVLAWLNGAGKLEYNGRVTDAWIYASIAPRRFVTIQEIDVSIVRAPFWFDINDTFSERSSNRGNVPINPLVRLTRRSDDIVEFSINGIFIKYDFKGENSVDIDCNTLNATHDTFNRNRQITIGYKKPTLLPGENKVRFTVGQCTIEFQRKDCWL